jgi:outer membrane protein W
MLRKPVLAALALTFSICLHAQFKKGDRMVGASVGTVFFNSSSTDLSYPVGSSSTTDNNYGIALSPSLGWFITDNVVVGVSPVINYNKQKQLGKSSNGNTYLKNDAHQFGAGLGGFARYYLKGSGATTRFFGQYNLSAGLNGSKNEGFQYETYGVYVDRYDQKSSGDFFVNTGVIIGLSKFLGNLNSLDFYIGYTFSYVKSNPKGTTIRDYADPGTPDINQAINYTQKFMGHNVVLGLGYQIFLSKKK